MLFTNINCVMNASKSLTIYYKQYQTYLGNEESDWYFIF